MRYTWADRSTMTCQPLPEQWYAACARHQFTLGRGVFLRFGLRGRVELWRLLELPQVQEEVARRSWLGLVLVWSFAYLAAVRAMVEAQSLEARERRWTGMVSIFAAEARLAGQAARFGETTAVLGRETAGLLRVQGLLRAAPDAERAGGLVEAAEVALERMLQLIEAVSAGRRRKRQEIRRRPRCG
jgi:hypothetical protein